MGPAAVVLVHDDEKGTIAERVKSVAKLDGDIGVDGLFRLGRLFLGVVIPTEVTSATNTADCSIFARITRARSGLPPECLYKNQMMTLAGPAIRGMLAW